MKQRTKSVGKKGKRMAMKQEKLVIDNEMEKKSREDWKWQAN